jgi:hypothetical protein
MLTSIRIQKLPLHQLGEIFDVKYVLDIGVLYFVLTTVLKRFLIPQFGVIDYWVNSYCDRLHIYSLSDWESRLFGPLDPGRTLRVVIPSILSLILGLQTILSSFFLSVLGMGRK